MTRLVRVITNVGQPAPDATRNMHRVPADLADVLAADLTLLATG